MAFLERQSVERSPATSEFVEFKQKAAYLQGRLQNLGIDGEDHAAHVQKIIAILEAFLTKTQTPSLTEWPPGYDFKTGATVVLVGKAEDGFVRVSVPMRLTTPRGFVNFFTRFLEKVPIQVVLNKIANDYVDKTLSVDIAHFSDKYQLYNLLRHLDEKEERLGAAEVMLSYRPDLQKAAGRADTIFAEIFASTNFSSDFLDSSEWYLAFRHFSATDLPQADHALYAALEGVFDRLIDTNAFSTAIRELAELESKRAFKPEAFAEIRQKVAQRQEAFDEWVRSGGSARGEAAPGVFTQIARCETTEQVLALAKTFKLTVLPGSVPSEFKPLREKLTERADALFAASLDAAGNFEEALRIGKETNDFRKSLGVELPLSGRHFSSSYERAFMRALNEEGAREEVFRDSIQVVIDERLASKEVIARVSKALIDRFW